MKKNKQKETLDIENPLKSIVDVFKVIKINWLLFLIIAVLNIIVFANSLHGEFVSDDIPGIVTNPQVSDLSKALTAKDRTLLVVLKSISYRYFGLNPFPMHIESLGIHIFNASLLFVILYILYNKKIAFIASLLFSVHPVVTESVDWLSGMNYLLFGAVFFSITLIYLLYKCTGKKLYLFSVYFLFVIASAYVSNYWNYTIPILLVLLDQFVLEKRLNKKILLVILPLVVVSVIFFLPTYKNTVTPRLQSLNTTTNDSIGFFQRLPYSVYMHGELLVFPKNLTLYHDGEIITFAKYRLMIAVTILVFILLPFVIAKSRKVGGLILMSYGAIAVALSPIQVAWFIADRYLYVPAALFCAVLSILFINLEKKYEKKYLATLLALVLLSAYSARTIIRNTEWKTPKALWLATERVGPNSPRVHNNLGDIYTTEKDLDKAVFHFKKAIELNPKYADALHNLGNVYMQMGQTDLAEDYLLQSFNKNPQLYQALAKLGLIAYNKGDVAVARGYFEQALVINPADEYSAMALDYINNNTQPTGE